MTIADEELMAYVDGELDAAARERVETAVAADATLAAKLGQQQSLMVSLPEPPSLKSTLYIWLRGETAGRASTISLNVPGPAL